MEGEKGVPLNVSILNRSSQSFCAGEERERRMRRSGQGGRSHPQSVATLIELLKKDLRTYRCSSETLSGYFDSPSKEPFWGEENGKKREQAGGLIKSKRFSHLKKERLQIIRLSTTKRGGERRLPSILVTHSWGSFEAE